MKHLPTTQDITNLSNSIARDGVATHQDALHDLAKIVRDSGIHGASADVLTDNDAAETQKARAFMVVARNWSEISAEFSRWASIRRSFAALASQWDAHRKLRSSPSPAIADLYSSRIALDAMRADAALTRISR